jgi:transcription antitermination factor NusG
MEQGFAVVLVAGLAVFGLMFVASESDLSSPNAPEQDKVIFVEENVGNVGGAETDIRNVSFRDFTVGEVRGNVQAYRGQTEDISSSLFSGDSINIDYNATQPRRGQISFEVLGRTGQGKIYAVVNGNRVFEAATVTGATPEINFSSEVLRHGMNDIKIGTTKGGLFSSATYTLEEIEVTVNDRKFHDFTDSFELYSHEVENYVSSNLSFTIPVSGSRPESDLKISVNSNEIFSEDLVRSTQQVEIDKREADLTPGYNTIEFSTEGDAKYEINNPEIVMRYIGSTSPETVRVDFEMTRGQLSYANQENTREVMSFDYQKLVPATNELSISLNGQSYSHLPNNGYNEVEIDAEALEEQNTLVIDSEGSFRMQNLQVLSEQVEG